MAKTKEREGNYVMIPRTLIEDCNDDALQLMVFSHLYIRRGLDDVAITSIRLIVEYCGYQEDRHRGKINKRVESILQLFKDCGYLTFDFADCKNKLLKIQINIDYFDSPQSFAIISLDELKKIKDKSTQLPVINVKPEKVLLVLCYIRVNKIRRQKYHQAQFLPEILYKHKKRLAEEIGINETTLRRCIDVLEQLDIIVTAPLNRYQDPSGRWHTNVTIFADKYGDWESEIKNGIDLLKSKGAIIKTKKGDT